MTDFQTGIITLMKSAVTGEGRPLPEGFSIDAAEEFAVRQSIIPLVYEGALLCGISPGEPAMRRMFPRYVRLTLHSEAQMAALESLWGAFDEQGIDYLPLKGCNMKKLYPKPELRYMGDTDILIRQEQYDRIRSIMEGCGYQEGIESLYEYLWKKPTLEVELHKSIVSPKSGVFYDYWGSGWSKAKGPVGTRYRLSPEDDFLFQLTHFAKHYMGPGIGCRYLLDLWVFMRANPDLDKEYLEAELERLQLLEFYNHLRVVISVWFEEQETDARTDFMTDFIFSGSSWGSWKTEQLSAALKNGNRHSQNKFMLILRKLFPPLSTMAIRYPILKKHRILLPVCWLRRIFRSVFLESGKRRRGLYMITDVTNERIDQYRCSMQYVGLYFEEE